MLARSRPLLAKASGTVFGTSWMARSASSKDGDDRAKSTDSHETEDKWHTRYHVCVRGERTPRPLDLPPSLRRFMSRTQFPEEHGMWRCTHVSLHNGALNREDAQYLADSWRDRYEHTLVVSSRYRRGFSFGGSWLIGDSQSIQEALDDYDTKQQQQQQDSTDRQL